MLFASDDRRHELDRTDDQFGSAAVKNRWRRWRQPFQSARAGSQHQADQRAASGVVPVMKLLEDSFSYSNQLGQRQGAGAVYLNVFHPDVLEFLGTKKENADEKSGQDAFFGTRRSGQVLRACAQKRGDVPLNLTRSKKNTIVRFLTSI